MEQERAKKCQRATMASATQQQQQQQTTKKTIEWHCNKEIGKWNRKHGTTLQKHTYTLPQSMKS